MGSPLRILHVVVNMNRGGAETLIMNLYRNIDREMVQFDFLTCKKGAFDEEIISLGGKVHRIPYVTEVGHTRFSRELKQFLRSHPEYKVIHSHMDRMSGLVLHMAKKADVPVRIAHSHNTESEGGLPARAYKWYVGSYLRRSSTHLYACSHVAAKWLFGGRSEQAFILKNGIETDTFQFSAHKREMIRKELSIKKDTFVIGHIGRFSEQKNHLFLLEIFAGIHKKCPNSILLLAGNGGLEERIRKKIAELNLQPFVKLLGVREDVPKLLQAFDVFAFPSFHEGLPVTLIEAQGAGLPCVISSNITSEVDMGIGLVEYLGISDKEVWIEHILNIEKENRSREILENALLQKGYDIRKTAKHTQTTYLSLKEAII